MTGAEVLDLLFGLHADHGFTLLLATHDATVAARCDRVIELRDGMVISDGSPAGPATADAT